MQQVLPERRQAQGADGFAVAVGGDHVRVTGISAARLTMALQGVVAALPDLHEVIIAGFPMVAGGNFATSMIQMVVPIRANVRLLARILFLFGHVYLAQAPFELLWRFCRLVDEEWLPDLAAMHEDGPNLLENAANEAIDAQDHAYMRVVFSRSAQNIFNQAPLLVGIIVGAIPALAGAGFSRSMVTVVFPARAALTNFRDLMALNQNNYEGVDFFIAAMAITNAVLNPLA